MNCSNCQRAIKDDATFCSHCGLFVLQQSTVQVEGVTPVAADEIQVEEMPTSATQAKRLKTVWLISVFGGWLGIDRFYLGHIGTGILKLLGAGWYGIWWTVDMIRLLQGRQVDKNGVLVEDPQNFRPVAVVISTVLFTLIGLCWLVVILALATPSPSD